MRNRCARRAPKARGFHLFVSIGRCWIDEGVKPKCFACGNEAEDWPWPNGPAELAHGYAQIGTGKQDYSVPICETCLNSADVDDVIVRKVLNMAEFDISKGAEAIAAALSERYAATAGEVFKERDPTKR